MQRFGIEDEIWFEAARTGLERRGFTLRLQPRSIIIDKDGRLPRIVGSAREFLEFAERQGLVVGAADYAVADTYGDGRSDLSGRASASPFESPSRFDVGPTPPPPGEFTTLAELRRPEVSAVELRLAELRLEQERMAAERRATLALGAEKRQLEQHCAALQAEIVRLTAVAAEAIKQRDLWHMTASSSEERLRVLQADADGPGGAGRDRRFDQLRRFLARELHPDLAGEDGADRAVREALFKRVWAKIEQLQ